jgi:glycerol kinase
MIPNFAHTIPRTHTIGNKTNRTTGQPYHNVIVWNDTRTRAICEELKRSSVS